MVLQSEGTPGVRVLQLPHFGNVAGDADPRAHVARRHRRAVQRPYARHETPLLVTNKKDGLFHLGAALFVTVSPFADICLGGALFFSMVGSPCCLITVSRVLEIFFSFFMGKTFFLVEDLPCSRSASAIAERRAAFGDYGL